MNKVGGSRGKEMSAKNYKDLINTLVNRQQSSSECQKPKQIEGIESSAYAAATGAVAERARLTAGA